MKYFLEVLTLNFKTLLNKNRLKWNLLNSSFINKTER